MHVAAVVLLALLKEPALTGRCATFVRDTHSSVHTFPNGTELHVDADRSGQLHVSAPAPGWIPISATVVYCGSKDLADQDAVMAAIDKVSARAKTDRLAADTLMRYQVYGAADGYAGETASDALAALMVENPKLLISVLDQLPDTKREDTLRGLVLTGSGDAARVRAFDKATSEEPTHPTSVTWRALSKKCGPGLTRLPNC